MPLTLILGDVDADRAPVAKERYAVHQPTYTYLSLCAQIDDAIAYRTPVNILLENGTKLLVQPRDWKMLAVECP